MATLDDKLLGEKLHNYCSSSEESDGENSDDNSAAKPELNGAQAVTPQNVNKWEGTSTNTGPKGVIKDWQRYKQLENEKRIESEKEKIELMKKLTLTVQTALDEEREKLAKEDPDLSDLLEDSFLMEYQKKRMQELLQQNTHNIKFGNLILLTNGQEFLDAIDKENKAVKVIVHIYEDNVEICKTMNNCLKELCKSYINVKFCALLSSQAGLSKKFKLEGVPALLVYQAGNLIGNFVKMGNELGNVFEASDVQSFLVEHGMLEDITCTPRIIRENSDDDLSD